MLCICKMNDAPKELSIEVIRGLITPHHFASSLRYVYCFIFVFSQFIESIKESSFAVSSTHAGRKPLRMAFFAEAMFDHAQQ